MPPCCTFLCCHDCCVQEERDHQLDTAAFDITRKLLPYNARYFGRLPYLLGFAVTENLMRAFRLMPTAAGWQREHLGLYNMTDFAQRLDAFGLMLRYTTLLSSWVEGGMLERQFPPAVSLIPMQRDRMTVWLAADGRFVRRQYKDAGIVMRISALREVAATWGLPWPPTLERVVDIDAQARYVDTLPICANLPTAVDAEVYKRDVREALAFLHALGYAHLDVRAENVLYDPVAKRLVLIDLEFVTKFGEPWPVPPPVTKDKLQRGPEAVVAAADDLEMLL